MSTECLSLVSMVTVFRLPVVPTGVNVDVHCTHNVVLCLRVVSYKHLTMSFILLWPGIV